MCFAVERRFLVLERNVIVRLLIVDSKWNCKGDFQGDLTDSTTVVDHYGGSYTLEPGDRVFTPIERPETQLPEHWCFMRSEAGDVAIYPLLAGQRQCFRKSELDSRKDNQPPFFPAMIQGSERYFLEVHAAIDVVDEESDDGELTYDDDGERGPDGSIGPAGTNIIS